jgi:hypothetical protein
MSEQNSLTTPVRVAGVGCNWRHEHAVRYRCWLEERGFAAKPVAMTDETFLVGYSHRPFSTSELSAALTVAKRQKKEEESPEVVPNGR